MVAAHSTEAGGPRGDEGRAWPYAQQCIDRLNRVLVVYTASAEALAG
jgi:hypothetical protein